MVRVILASESPRRKEIMEKMGIQFESMVADINEEVLNTKPRQMVQELAALKAKKVADIFEDDYDNKIVIIGADTMVFHKGRLMGKPVDEEDAFKMIKMISNDVHQVYTGVCIIILEDGKETKRISFASSTGVWVNPLSPKQIKDYLATGEPMDKAGAYGIQGRFGIFIKKIQGDYYNVVGLPIAEIYEKLLEVGIDIINK